MPEDGGCARDAGEGSGPAGGSGQATFAGTSDCARFVPNRLRPGLCCDCMHSLFAHRAEAVADEATAVRAAIEHSQAGERVPTAIPLRRAGLGTLFMGGFRAVLNGPFLADRRVAGVVNCAKGLEMFGFSARRRPLRARPPARPPARPRVPVPATGWIALIALGSDVHVHVFVWVRARVCGCACWCVCADSLLTCLGHRPQSKLSQGKSGSGRLRYSALRTHLSLFCECTYGCSGD